MAITVHEFSHGLVATLFGDSTPRRAGRLTLNPLKHLDPIGTLLILVGPIGWGRPMPINPGEMRNPNLGWAMSSLAGPVSNVLTASVVVLAIGLVQGGVGSLDVHVHQRDHRRERQPGGLQPAADPATGWLRLPVRPGAATR